MSQNLCHIKVLTYDMSLYGYVTFPSPPLLRIYYIYYTYYIGALQNTFVLWFPIEVNVSLMDRHKVVTLFK